MTKHNYLVRDADDLPRVIAEAFHIARSGRPGPVHVDITKDALQQETRAQHPTEAEVIAGLPGFRPNMDGHPRQLKSAAAEIAAAKRPVILAGHGVLHAEAWDDLVAFAEKTHIPVAWTLLGIGVIDETHPLAYGYMGMHGWKHVNRAIQSADLLIAIGMRFDDRVTGNVRTYAPYARIVHADIDPAEIGKNRNADVPIVGDVKAVIRDLLEALRRDGLSAASLNIDHWWEYLRSVQATYPLSYGPQSDGSLSPEFVIESLGRIAGPDALYVAGVGQHQMWAAQFIKYENPRTWLNSGGLGTMGFAIPAAMGAKFARPDAEVWAIDGDGCFQMTNQELATCTVEGAPIKVAVINNGNLGMVRQWQTLFYEERYSQTNLSTHGQRVPDFVKLAEAYGCVGLRCERAEDVEDVINQARAINDRPVVIDFIVGADAQVWPMVAAGMSNDEIQAAKGIRPLFDDQGNEGHA
ncbi:MAG: acetolactate synthase large subunit, partial [Mycobacterium sp.]|nr:acetolactate synthase large subunit [Mycobacterium sp.]